jgi:hypothetical protein
MAIGTVPSASGRRRSELSLSEVFLEEKEEHR